MKRPSEMNDEEFGRAIDNLTLGIGEIGAADWCGHFGKRVREFLAGYQSQPTSPDLTDLRAEVSRTAAVVQALAMALGDPRERGGLTDKTRWSSLFYEADRLIDLRAQQAKLDTVLGEVAK